MKTTASAKTKLQEMLSRLGDEVGGYRITGFLGTCRGSTPVLEPVRAPAEGDVEVLDEPVRLFVVAEYADLLQTAELDYDATFMGKGLCMTWQHQEGCPCRKR